ASAEGPPNTTATFTTNAPARGEPRGGGALDEPRKGPSAWTWPQFDRTAAATQFGLTRGPSAWLVLGREGSFLDRFRLARSARRGALPLPRGRRPLLARVPRRGEGRKRTQRVRTSERGQLPEEPKRRNGNH